MDRARGVSPRHPRSEAGRGEEEDDTAGGAGDDAVPAASKVVKPLWVNCLRVSKGDELFSSFMTFFQSRASDSYSCPVQRLDTRSEVSDRLARVIEHLHQNMTEPLLAPELAKMAASSRGQDNSQIQCVTDRNLLIQGFLSGRRSCRV
jgi:hypothetical protein